MKVTEFKGALNSITKYVKMESGLSNPDGVDFNLEGRGISAIVWDGEKSVGVHVKSIDLKKVINPS